MESWDKRPFEYRRLFNPAFCAVLLLRAMKGYKVVSGRNMPFSLSFLVLPLCLHEDSRRILKSNTRSNFLNVIANYPELLVGFPTRASFLVPYTLEGLGLAHHKRSFTIGDNGTLSIEERGVLSTHKGSPEVRECQKAAEYLGKSFARTGSKVTIFTSLGVRP